jgi:tetratricopeptide (TPR) repeat protein
MSQSTIIKSRRRYDRTASKALFVVGLWLAASLLAAGPVHSQPDGQDGGPDCRHCGKEAAEINQRLKRAEGFYSSFKPQEALKELLRVLAVNPQHHEALVKTARAYVDVGDLVSDAVADWQEQRLKHYRIAETYARKAVSADPNSTWGHFYIAASLGKIALLSPIPTQIDLSKEIREAVERALALDPRNGFAYHVYGMWQRRMAEIGQMSRMLATLVLRRTVPEGSMEKSEEYFQKAISLNPTVIAHRLEMAKTSIALAKWQQARTQLRSALELPIRFSDDPQHKQEAQQLLQELKDRQ